MSTISVSELELIFKQIICKLKREGYKNLVVEDTFYRIIPTDEWNNYEKDVVEVGDLQDDVNGLLQIINNPDRQCTYVDFDRVASLLRAISQHHNPPLE